MRATNQEVEDELLRIREALEYEKEAISSNYSALWKDKSLRKRIALALIINAGQQITGQGSLNTYSTKIYHEVFPSSSQIALINALNATFGIIFTLNAVWIIDRFGRTFLLLVGGVGMGVCMIIVSAVETETPTHNNTKSTPVGISIVFLLFLFIFFSKSAASFARTGAKHVFRQTILGRNSLDLDIRGLLHECLSSSRRDGLADTERCQRHFPTVLPYFLDNCGFYAFYMFAGINFLLAIFVFFFIPETKHVPLEEIDALFGGANHVTRREELIPSEKQEVQHKE